MLYCYYVLLTQNKAYLPRGAGGWYAVCVHGGISWPCSLAFSVSPTPQCAKRPVAVLATNWT